MKYLLLSVCLTAALPFVSIGAAADSRCFELRTYYAASGKLDALHARFRDHTMELFRKHGMSNIGYWVPADNPDNKLVYLMAYPSRDKRQESWKAFSVDPEWRKAFKESIGGGRLVSKVESVFLEATDYSPGVKPAKGEETRLFELRTYKTPPGKLDALHARFRDHTIKLFSKHGMTHIGYWTPMDAESGSEDTLIYLLAHESPEARNQSFAAFRTDPDWISAKAESEKEGSLTTKVESVLLTPTDYSPTR